MIELSRTVRFCINPSRPDAATPGRHNTFAGWPTMAGIGVYYELIVRCRGEVDSRLGLMLNIAEIDRAVRAAGVPIVDRAVRDRDPREPSALLPAIAEAVQAELAHVVASVTWRLTPYHSVTLETADMDRVLIAQQFEFAAAHQLSCPDLSEEENRRIFGKCTNPSGHGHNYRLEVAVSRPLEPPAGEEVLQLAELERIVDTEVIERFDHKHLNRDAAEFEGLNPSVEHIARVCHDLLEGPLAAAGVRLERVTVWETEKTSCTYGARA